MDDTRSRDFTSKDFKGKDALEKILKKNEILPDPQVIIELRKEISDGKVVEAVFDQYKKRLEAIKPHALKFKNALLSKYSTAGLSLAQLIEKGRKYKKKYDLSDGEFSMFINLVLSDRTYAYPNMYNIPSTSMSKTLGYSVDAVMGDKLNFTEAETSDLQVILTKNAEYKQIHSQLVMQSLIYHDCSPDALSGKFESKKDLAFNFVHPVIAALFLPKIPYLDQHMLLASISNIVKTKSEGKPIMTQPEYELYWDMITDPNQMACATEGMKPMADLRNRVILQTKLWESVMLLRQGKYYKDDMAKFMMAVENCQNSIFDAPDLTFIHDEGTILRRILNAFSMRPTVVSIAPLFSGPVTTSYALTAAPLSVGQITTVPMINMRLPTGPMGIVPGVTKTTIALRDALAQPQWFIEGKTLVPKSQNIVHSRDLIFFYANRRFQTMNYSTLTQPYVFKALPTTMTGIQTLNDLPIMIDPSMIIGDEEFHLRSVVVVEESRTESGKKFISGCNTLIVYPINVTSGHMSNDYLMYDPQMAGIKIPSAGTFVQNDPITWIPYSNPPFVAGTPSVESFLDRAQKRGTIYMYAK